MKKYLFDTSVIVAGTLESHPHLVPARRWLGAATGKKIEAFVSVHSLAELYSNLSVPHQDSISSPKIAREMIDEWISSVFNVIEFKLSDYQKAIERVSRRSLRGGIIYDSLHVQAALKRKVNALVTLNSKHFDQLVKEGELQIFNPLADKP